MHLGNHSLASEAPRALLDPAPLAPQSKTWLPEVALAKRDLATRKARPRESHVHPLNETKVTRQSGPREVSDPGNLGRPATFSASAIAAHEVAWGLTSSPARWQLPRDEGSTRPVALPGASRSRGEGRMHSSVCELRVEAAGTGKSRSQAGEAFLPRGSLLLLFCLRKETARMV